MRRQLPRTFFVLALLFTSNAVAQVQTGDARDREIAARFAPVFVQALGDDARGDLITRFDFDGDWRGDNNWANGGDAKHRLRAFVYYAVSETATHYFVHYAVFHPRDYKGGSTRGAILSQVIKEGVRRGGKYDPTGLSESAVLAHDRFIKYEPAEVGRPGDAATVRLDGGRPMLYVEPKGHGIYSYSPAHAERSSAAGVLEYRYEGRADDPEVEGAKTRSVVGYDLVSIYTTLWPRARRSPNATFGAKYDYGTRSVSVAGGAKRGVKLGELGAAFAGSVGAANAARPPWAWFDREERAAPLGEWFFDPATSVKRRTGAGADFSTAYLHQPFLGVRRKTK